MDLVLSDNDEEECGEEWRKQGKVCWEMQKKMREGGLMSCRSRNQKLCTFTEKELETVKAALKLLGAPTIGRRSALAGSGGGGS